MNPNMKQLEEATGIKIRYNAEVSASAYSIYTVTTTDSDKHLFDVLVDSKDMMTVVYPDALTQFETGHKAVIRTEVTENGVSRRVSSDGIRAYVYPRAARFLAHYYVK